MITVRCSSGDEAYAPSPAAAQACAHQLIEDACVADGGARGEYTARYQCDGYRHRVVLRGQVAVAACLVRAGVQ